MSMTTTTSKRLGILAVLGIAGAAGACSTVSPDEMDTGLASLRAEMLEEMGTGDARVSSELGGRIGQVERRLAELDADLREMESDFEVAVERLETELRFNVPVYFGFDDATIEEEDMEILNRFASVTQKYYPRALITVEGFTDKSGGEAYNLQLGQRRADAVKGYLVGNNGMSDELVRAVSYGENTERLVMPETWGPGATGWENRRVVLVIEHDGVAPAMATEEGTQQ
jgi:peptidoglycan-associated lipoprotein